MVVQMVFDPLLFITKGTISFFMDHIFAAINLHQRINELRSEVNTLQSEVNSLQHENNRLEDSTAELKLVKEQLNDVSILQGQSVEKLMEQVQQIKQTQEQIKEHLQAKVVQNLISVVLNADNDKDSTIDPEEIDGLMMRLQAIDGVNFSKTNFFKALEGYQDPDTTDDKGYSFKFILDIMKNLIDDDVPEEENIFTIQTDRVLNIANSK